MADVRFELNLFYAQEDGTPDLRFPSVLFEAAEPGTTWGHVLQAAAAQTALPAYTCTPIAPAALGKKNKKAATAAAKKQSLAEKTLQTLDIVTSCYAACQRGTATWWEGFTAGCKDKPDTEGLGAHLHVAIHQVVMQAILDREAWLTKVKVPVPPGVAALVASLKSSAGGHSTLSPPKNGAKEEEEEKKNTGHGPDSVV